MAVTINLVNKQYIRVEGTNDAERIWSQIKSGIPIETGRYGEEAMVNPDNVTSVQAGR